MMTFYRFANLFLSKMFSSCGHESYRFIKAPTWQLLMIAVCVIRDLGLRRGVSHCLHPVSGNEDQDAAD